MMKTLPVDGDFVCTECGAYVHNPEVVSFTTNTGVSNYMICPYCGEDALAEAEPCPSCHGWMKQGEECCDKCKKEGEGALGIFVRSIPVPILRYLDEYIEGTCLEEFR